jgi:hypothetical protein
VLDRFNKVGNRKVNIRLPKVKIKFLPVLIFFRRQEIRSAHPAIIATSACLTAKRIGGRGNNYVGFS